MLKFENFVENNRNNKKIETPPKEGAERVTDRQTGKEDN